MIRLSPVEKKSAKAKINGDLGSQSIKNSAVEKKAKGATDETANGKKEKKTKVAEKPIVAKKAKKTAEATTKKAGLAGKKIKRTVNSALSKTKPRNI